MGTYIEQLHKHLCFGQSRESSFENYDIEELHLVLGLCVFSFLGKTAYYENRIIGESKIPKFFNPIF